MSDTAGKGALPQTIKINGVDVDINDPEVQRLMEAVRKQEKDKLNSDKAQLKAELQKLENEKKAGDLKLGEYEKEKKRIEDELAVANSKLKEKSDAGSGAGGSSGSGSGKPEEKKSEGGLSREELQKILEENNKALLGTLGSKFETIETRLNGKVVGDYRSELLEKHKDIIVPDLLVGSTKEELDAALPRALEISANYIFREVDGKRLTLKEIAEQEKQKSNGTGGNSGAGAGNGTGANGDHIRMPGGPGQQQVTATGKELLEKVKDMSDEDYNKNADNILAETRRMLEANQKK